MQQIQSELKMNKPKNVTVNLLPRDPVQAIQKMIKISQRLLDMAERETQALLQDDVLSFGVVQDEKDIIVSQYAAMSREFRERLNDFRRVDQSLLQKLEKVQNQLGDKARANNNIVTELKEKAARNTQKTLFTVQELAQIKPVHLPESDQQHQTGA